MAVLSAGGKFWAARLPPSTGSVPLARHFTADALRALGAEAPAEVAELLVSELATNAVLHAGTPMRLSVWRRGGNVRIEVRDDNPHFPRVEHSGPMTTGGRGMFLVDALAAAWGVNGNDRGKTIWFELAG